jgi:glycosyltransferase involved in cell wall biosynthesis
MSKPLQKVLIIVENLSVPNDRRVWLEAKTLQESGYEVSVISIKGKERAKAAYELLEGVHLYRYPAPPPTSGLLSFIWEFSYCWLATAWLSLRIAISRGIDIIHACNPPETFWLIGHFYKLFGKKFIFDHHDLSPEMYFSRFGKRGTAYRLLLVLEKLTFKTADVVITTNESHQKVALERGSVALEDIYIVRSGPDHELFEPGPVEESLKQGHHYMVSYLGVLNPQDGVDAFVELAQHIVHTLERPDILFVVMGSGDALSDLEQLSRDLGVDDYMHFTGWADKETIIRYISTSDLCVDTMPKTPYGDASTMNKIMEYMAFGKAIVSFDLTESRVSAAEAAVYAEPGNIADMAEKVLDLLADEDRRAEMGQCGRSRIENELAWEHQKQNLLAAYEALQR